MYDDFFMRSIIEMSTKYEIVDKDSPNESAYGGKLNEYIEQSEAYGQDKFGPAYITAVIAGMIENENWKQVGKLYISPDKKVILASMVMRDIGKRRISYATSTVAKKVVKKDHAPCAINDDEANCISDSKCSWRKPTAGKCMMKPARKVVQKAQKAQTVQNSQQEEQEGGSRSRPSRKNTQKGGGIGETISNFFANLFK